MRTRVEPPSASRDLRSRARSPSAGTERAWRKLSREIRACRRCPLGSFRTHAVVYRGSLAPRIVFIGEAPGAEEDRRGIPFVGRSGERLNAAIRTLGLVADSFGVLNVLKCRPPGNRFDRSAARTCRPHLDRQLALLHPEVVVTLGAHALRSVDPTAPPVLMAAGKPRGPSAPSVFPLIHPAATFRSRQWSERWARDLAALGDWYRSRDLKTQGRSEAWP